MLRTVTFVTFSEMRGLPVQDICNFDDDIGYDFYDPYM